MIKKLPSDVISKIAAGEVIERPAYVVKELVENSIDSQADTITLSVEGHGLEQITVTDNGIGMSRLDVQLCFLPHTTSKLSSLDDLHHVASFGFRGEALSSIAHIATLLIQTRRKEDIGGTLVVIKNGKLDELSSTGSSKGTRISVTDLFSTIPARKKFLKSDKTEFRLIGEIYASYVLSHPNIHFIFKHNDKVVFDFPKNDTLQRRVSYFFGSLSTELLPLRCTENNMEISGFIGKPQVASRNNKQHIFVNNRYVRDQIISLSVKEAFGTLLPSSFLPVFMLSISLPVEMTDVNIHPRKEQIAFFNQKLLFDTVKQAVTDVLNENNLTFKMAKFKRETSAKISESDSSAGFHLKQDVLSDHLTSLGNVKRRMTFTQINHTYICFAVPDGLALIDQHAAHERILFEEFTTMYKQKKRTSETVSLLTEKKILFSFSDSQIFEEYESYFKELGFSFEHLKGTGIIVRKIPALFKGRNIEKIIEDIIAELRQDISLSPIDKRSEKMLRFLSCKAAVKAGDPLHPKQMKELVIRLEKSENNTTCPHGRPTTIIITHTDFDKMFKRK